MDMSHEMREIQRLKKKEKPKTRLKIDSLSLNNWMTKKGSCIKKMWNIAKPRLSC